MTSKEDQPTYIKKTFFPPSLIVAMRKLKREITKENQVEIESNSGKNILQVMVSQKMNRRDVEFVTKKYEKPQAFLNGNPISVSFSHTSTDVCAAVSEEWVVGIDMESQDRTVSGKLSNRMRNHKELLKFYDEHPIIQIWTMKEAALKAIGTGLRKPMNSVQLSAESEYLYRAEFDNGTLANICSFLQDKQWISICYISSQLSESFLPESYVPIHTGRDQRKAQ